MKSTFRTLLLLSTTCIGTFTSDAQRKGMVKVNGTWVAPTPEIALQRLLASAEADLRKDNGEDVSPLSFDGEDAAVAVLRQVYSRHTATELDALALELERLYRYGDEVQSHNAWMVLTDAGGELGDGIRYARAASIFVKIYESFSVRTEPRAFEALLGVMYAGGDDYIHQVFKKSKKPLPCTPFWAPGIESNDVNSGSICPNEATWCDAGYLLLTREHEGGPDHDEYNSLCPLKVGRDGRQWIESH